MSKTTSTAKETPKIASKTPQRARSRTAVAPKSTPKESLFSVAPIASSKENKFHALYHKHRGNIQKAHLINFFLILFAVMFVGISGVAAYSYHLYQKSEKQVHALQNGKATAKVEVQKTIDAVGKIIVLPKDETPTIATVTDSKKLKNQPFFAKASNGDKVLIYSKGKKAILYNPTQNIVVEVAPVNIGKNAKSAVAGAAISPTQAPIPTPTIVFQQQVFPTLQPTTQP